MNSRMNDVSYMSILQTGPGTSIQDKGRLDFSRFGVPSSGALDAIAATWVNHILRNNLDAAVLEISHPGLIIQFHFPTIICLAGADADLSINRRKIVDGVHVINENDVLKIGNFKRGSILYLGIKHGFQTEQILGSRSWFKGITAKSQCKKNEVLYYLSSQEACNPSTGLKPKWKFEYFEKQIISVYPGPEWQLLSQKTQNELIHKEWKISNLKNRMAIQIEGMLENDLDEIYTAPVFPGTVQLTPSGKIIVLMRDAQTTGGYPRILQLTEESISKIAQKKVGEHFKFELKTDFHN